MLNYLLQRELLNLAKTQGKILPRLIVNMSSEPKKKIAKMGSSLEQLKNYTTVVADTGDFEGKDIF